MNQSDTFSHELEERLHALADDVVAPGTSLGDDLSRGRSARRRHRLAIGGSALAVAAVVGLGAVGVGQLAGGGTSSVGPAGGGVSPTGAEDPAPPEVSPTMSLSLDPSGELAEGTTTGIPLTAPMHEYAPELTAYNDVLAEHLDPQREHLQAYSPTTGNVQYSDDGSTLGSKFAWTIRGEEGMGMLQVSVMSDWSGLYWDCDSGWTCSDAVGPGGEKARVAQHDGVLDVAVRHADGHVVGLTFDLLFGNNSTVPVSGADLTPEKLIAAAADPRLVLPARD